jgi:hypothetical protein
MDDLLGPQKGPSSPAKINAEVKATKLRLEEIEDAKAVEEARKEGGAVPYEEFRKTLDLTIMEPTIINCTFDVVKHNYKVEAMDATGYVLNDIMEGENEQDVIDRLRTMGYYVTKIHQFPPAPKKGYSKTLLKVVLFVTFPIWIIPVVLYTLCAEMWEAISDLVED